MLSILSELESCFLLQLSPQVVDTIRPEPFKLACGETLEIFDGFTEIGSSGSAGNLPIKLAEPWVQRYRGLLTADNKQFNWMPDSWVGRDLVLFDAINPDEISEGFVSPSYRNKWNGTRSANDGYYMAYLRFMDDKLFHTRGGSASSVCGCTSLTRWKG